MSASAINSASSTRVTPGKLIVISGPAGVGKDTVLTRAMTALPNLVKSVSVTTRPPSPGEIEGRSYFFVGEDEFLRLRDADELLEWAVVHNHLYGTPAKWVREQTATGHNVVMNIDVQGGLQIKRNFPAAALVFVQPPGDPLATLRERLRARGRDSDRELEVRLSNAMEEMKCASQYDFQITNDDAERAAAEFVRIVASGAQ